MLKRFLSYWAPVAAYAGLIFFLSSLSQSSIHFLLFLHVPHFDKVAHLGEYGAFGLLLARAFFAGGAAFTPRQSVAGALIVAALYGASDEFHQFFVPTRACEWGDWIADSVGGFLGGVAWFVLVRMTGRVPPPAGQETTA